MARFIQVSDFHNGEFLLSTQSDTTELQAIIDRLEVEVLQDLMGREMYDAFIADLDTNVFPQAPQEQRFIDIYNPFYLDDTCRLRSEGIIKMLQMFIWFEAIKDQGQENTPVGIVTNQFENSTNRSNSMAGIGRTYNRAVNTFNDIAHYINLESSIYPEYNCKGIIKQVISLVV